MGWSFKTSFTNYNQAWYRTAKNMKKNSILQTIAIHIEQRIKHVKSLTKHAEYAQFGIHFDSKLCQLAQLTMIKVQLSQPTHTSKYAVLKREYPDAGDYNALYIIAAPKDEQH